MMSGRVWVHRVFWRRSVSSAVSEFSSLNRFRRRLVFCRTSLLAVCAAKRMRVTRNRLLLLHDSVLGKRCVETWSTMFPLPWSSQTGRAPQTRPCTSMWCRHRDDDEEISPSSRTQCRCIYSPSSFHAEAYNDAAYDDDCQSWQGYRWEGRRPCALSTKLRFTRLAQQHGVGMEERHRSRLRTRPRWRCRRKQTCHSWEVSCLL
ncbi:hypothetical protein OH77DRAFT_366512 [Trametes cingulata]|nr:hypothetical protein OH77DRAFT_366512 [Trametes cingulata]